MSPTTALSAATAAPRATRPGAASASDDGFGAILAATTEPTQPTAVGDKEASTNAFAADDQIEADVSAASDTQTVTAGLIDGAATLALQTAPAPPPVTGDVEPGIAAAEPTAPPQALAPTPDTAPVRAQDTDIPVQKAMAGGVPTGETPDAKATPPALAETLVAAQEALASKPSTPTLAVPPSLAQTAAAQMAPAKTSASPAGGGNLKGRSSETAIDLSAIDETVLIAPETDTAPVAPAQPVASATVMAATTRLPFDAQTPSNAAAAGIDTTTPVPDDAKDPKQAAATGLSAPPFAASAGMTQPTASSVPATPALPDQALVDAGHAPDVAEAAPAPTYQTASASAAVTAQSLSGMAHVATETLVHLAAQISRRLEGRSTRFDMALTPEGLGRVDVSLDIDADGQLAARLAFDNPLAATELRGRADELRRQLEDAGFTLARDALDFSERDGSASGGFDRRQNNAFAKASRTALDADPALAGPAAWTSLNLTPRGVDMKV